MDEYRLILDRREDETYGTKLICNGNEVNVTSLPEPIGKVIATIGFNQLRILADFQMLSKLETTISGENLK